jgi:tRNA-specific 2-thiouridylase
MRSSIESNQSKERRKAVYAVAMSGGVDSSVVAAMLQRAGHYVFGVTMDIHENCTKDIDDAREVCKNLGIQHDIFDVRSEYKARVIDLFVEYYSKGLTPNPCAFCNRDLKLNILVDYALNKGADLLATGHYAKLLVNGDTVILREAENTAKDQTYFVSLAKRNKLKFVRFPLGEIKSKDETRAIAAEYGLPNFEKNESQDICFIRHGSYKEFLQNLQTNLNLFSPGRIRLSDTGETIGCHSGIANFTVGQRKGLGVSSKKPLYVVDVDSECNDIIVGSKEDLAIPDFCVTLVNWIMDVDRPEFEAFAKLRSFGKKVKVIVKKLENEQIHIRLCEENSTPVTKGQVCAIYDQIGQVICSGIISPVLHN